MVFRYNAMKLQFNDYVFWYLKLIIESLGFVYITEITFTSWNAEECRGQGFKMSHLWAVLTDKIGHTMPALFSYYGSHFTSDITLCISICGHILIHDLCGLFKHKNLPIYFVGQIEDVILNVLFSLECSWWGKISFIMGALCNYYEWLNIMEQHWTNYFSPVHVLVDRDDKALVL